MSTTERQEQLAGLSRQLHRQQGELRALAELTDNQRGELIEYQTRIARLEAEVTGLLDERRRLRDHGNRWRAQLHVAYHSATRKLGFGTAIGVLLILIGALLSPASLKEVGAMRIALESENEMVRSVAEFEVMLIRAGAVVAGALCVLLSWHWGRVEQARPIWRLRAYRPILPPPGVGSADFLNLSTVATAVALLGTGVLMLAGEAMLGQERFRELSAEDGPIEQATAYFFLLAAIVAFAILLQTTTRARRIMPIWMVIGFFVCFAEEISWGQRMFSFATPEPIKKINVQAETNVHNMFGYAADHLFILGLFAFGVMLPLLAWQFPLVHRLCDRLALPIPSLGLAGCFLVISALHSWTVYRLVPETPVRVAEIRECLAAFAILVLMIDHWSRLRRVELTRAPRLPGRH